MLFLTSFSIFAIAKEYNVNNQIVMTYKFDLPSISKITINGESYDQVNMMNSPGANNPGEPNLPCHGVNLLLPQGSEVIDIEVNPGNRIYLGNGYNVEPTLEPVKLSEIHQKLYTLKDENIYRSKNIFPKSLFRVIDTYSFRGYDILVIMLYPVQYIPYSGALYYFNQMTISVKIIENNQINPLFRGLKKDENLVSKKIDNPLCIDTYREPLLKFISLSDIDLLIITTNEFENSFLPLKNAHEANGMKTEIKTLSDIRLISDLVTAEDIREYIKDKYIKDNLEFVLIGGDYDVIPTKDLWVQAWKDGDQTFMPSDLYYACLDGPFNFDGDEKWGEPTDGEDGGDVDLYAEVYVGRACVGNTDEVDHFVEKTIAYMNSGGYSSGQVLMVGEHLWSDPDTWGGNYMDELINGSNHNRYKTIGIPSNIYDIETLYDRDWPDNYWPKTEIIDRINDNTRIINHDGHASYGYNMKMVNNDVNSLSNNDPCFIYSQGCMSGGFDDPHGFDCIAEYFTVKTDKAAFAVIMNARYGWGVKGGTNGASQRFHRQFFDAIFGENITEIGKANQDSKEDNLHRIIYPCIRWCYYQLNLFGDPTLIFYQNNNHKPNQPDRPSGKLLGLQQIDYEFITSATDQDGDQLYYRWDWGDGTFSKWLGPYNSSESISMEHSWTKMGLYKVRVKTRDEHLAQSVWSDSFPVIMPKNNLLKNSFTKGLFERFTNIYQLFRLMQQFLNT